MASLRTLDRDEHYKRIIEALRANGRLTIVRLAAAREPVANTCPQAHTGP